MTNTGIRVADGSHVPTAAMVAMGRRLAEVRMRPDGNAVGWVQRGGGPGELMIASLASSDAGVTVGAHTVLATLPPIVAPHPSGGGSWCWLPDGSGVVYASKAGLCLASADGGPIRVVVAAGEGRQLWSAAVDPTGTWLAYVDEGNFDAFVAVRLLHSPSGPGELSWRGRAVSGGVVVEPEVQQRIRGGVSVRVSLAEDNSFVLDPEWGADGLLAWHAWTAPAMPWDRSRVDIAAIRAADDGIAEVHARGSVVGGRVSQPRWSGARLSWIDDASGYAVVTSATVRRAAAELVIDGVASITDTSEHGGPTWGPGQRTTAWSPDGSAIAFERNEAGFGRLCVAVPGAIATGDAFSGRPVGRGVHGSISWAVTSHGQHRLAAVRQGATTPVQVVVYDTADPRVTVRADVGADAGVAAERVVGSDDVWRRTVVATSAVMGWDQVNLVEPIEVSAPNADGGMVPGRLYRAASTRGQQMSGPLPTIVAIHGGPTDQTRVEWNARFAAYVAAGWQVLAVDHRGSTGWGRAHQQALNEQWGVVDVSDTVALLRWLMDNGRVDPARVVVSGGSAGGFTVLSLLIAHPELFAGGIALYPVTDLVALEASTHRFEAHYQRTLIGERPKYEQRYIDRSPVHSAGRLRVPLLLFHGTEDKVVDVAQSDALAAALAANGVSHRYVRFEGEGHGWSKPETTAAEHEAVMTFLQSVSERNALPEVTAGA